MRGLHLKKRGNRWHYFRNRPKRFDDVEKRQVITFALHTDCFSKAKMKAAQISHDLEKQWASALERGVSLRSDNHAQRFAAAQETNRAHGFPVVDAEAFADDELLKRLHHLLRQKPSQEEQKAILGLVQKPDLSLIQAFDRFWEHIADDYEGFSHDQLRGKRNVFLKSIRHFTEAVGEVSLYEIQRSHAIHFRQWWMQRKKAKGLKSYTANREITSVRRMVAVSYEIDGVEDRNPFARVRLKADKESCRTPLTREQIKANILAVGKLDNLLPELRLLVLMMVNTGARPVEIIGLELSDIKLDDPAPHILIRPNGVRVLKTESSERPMPLLGVSMEAAEELVANGGWSPNRLGKNMSATSAINKNFRENGTFEEKGQSLYSLRHYFQDQLTKQSVLDRVQCQLMGHKFNRPRYGAGLDLLELRDIIAKFAL